MKIAAVMGSPHEGNSLEKVREVERRLREKGDVEFSYIHLKDADLQPCRGCYACFLYGEDRCPLRDDREKMAGVLEEADGVIFATPVYSMHVSYLFKRFVDRFAYNFHRPGFAGKYSLSVVTAGAIGLKDTLGYIRNTATVWGFDHVADIGIVAPPKNTPLKPLMARKDTTGEAVDRFHAAIRDRRPKKLSLNDSIMFMTMRAFYARLEAFCPRDYAYWKERGWFGKDAVYYHDNVRRNIPAEAVARLIGRFAGWSMDRKLAWLGEG